MADKVNSSGEVVQGSGGGSVYTDAPVDQSRVTKIVKKETADAELTAEKLGKLTKEELVARATAAGLNIPTTATKSEIIDELLA